MVQDYWLLDEKETQPYIDVTCFNQAPKDGDPTRKNRCISREELLKEKKSKEKGIKENGTTLDIEPGLGKALLLLKSSGFKVNDHTSKEVSALMEEYSEEWVIKAINRSADMRKPTLGYVKGILNNWRLSGGADQGYSTSGLDWEEV